MGLLIFASLNVKWNKMVAKKVILKLVNLLENRHTEYENLLSLFTPLLKLPPGLESNPENSTTEDSGLGE